MDHQNRWLAGIIQIGSGAPTFNWVRELADTELESLSDAGQLVRLAASSSPHSVLVESIRTLADAVPDDVHAGLRTPTDEERRRFLTALGRVGALAATSAEDWQAFSSDIAGSASAEFDVKPLAAEVAAAAGPLHNAVDPDDLRFHSEDVLLVRDNMHLSDVFSSIFTESEALLAHVLLDGRSLLDRASLTIRTLASEVLLGTPALLPMADPDQQLTMTIDQLPLDDVMQVQAMIHQAQMLVSRGSSEITGSDDRSAADEPDQAPQEGIDTDDQTDDGAADERYPPRISLTELSDQLRAETDAVLTAWSAGISEGDLIDAKERLSTLATAIAGHRLRAASEAADEDLPMSVPPDIGDLAEWTVGDEPGGVAEIILLDLLAQSTKLLIRPRRLRATSSHVEVQWDPGAMDIPVGLSELLAELVEGASPPQRPHIINAVRCLRLALPEAALFYAVAHFKRIESPTMPVVDALDRAEQVLKGLLTGSAHSIELAIAFAVGLINEADLIAEDSR